MKHRQVAALAAVLLLAELASAANWPRILPFEHLYNFGRPQDMYLNLPIRAANGKLAYILSCASPENPHAPAGNAAHRRQFECRLSLPDARTAADSQLLTGDSGSDREWTNRAGFSWNQVTGECARYPDYGIQRIFRLRNMRLIITLSSVRLLPNAEGNKEYKYQIHSMTVRVQGFYDPSALSPVAMPSKYQEPEPVKAGDFGGPLVCKAPVLKH